MTMKHKTMHTLSTGRTTGLTGSRLFDVAASTKDGQAAREVIAADSEGQATTRLMLVQRSMKLCGQIVTFRVSEVAS
jgi:microcompartment protein CcmK/EutM